MEGLSVTLLGLVNFSLGFSMRNPLVIVFIATEVNATQIKHCSHTVRIVCLFLAQQPPSGPGPPHSRGF